MFWKQKKYIYSQVKRIACDGTGKNIPLTGWGLDYSNLNILKMMQGICLGCNGTGSQTVLDKAQK